MGDDDVGTDGRTIIMDERMVANTPAESETPMTTTLLAFWLVGWSCIQTRKETKSSHNHTTLSTLPVPNTTSQQQSGVAGDHTTHR